MSAGNPEAITAKSLEFILETSSSCLTTQVNMPTKPQLRPELEFLPWRNSSFEAGRDLEGKVPTGITPLALCSGQDVSHSSLTILN